MVSLYAMLFDSDKYNEPATLTFDYNPIFYGMGPQKFEYTTSTIQSAILAEFQKNDFLGVCCEPNCIFVICNQFPLIAMRYNDVRNGTDVVGPVLERYVAAWEKRGGLVGATGQVVDFWLIEQGVMVARGAIWTSAWYFPRGWG
jgi:Linalool dehydratase/isomerase